MSFRAKKHFTKYLNNSPLNFNAMKTNFCIFLERIRYSIANYGVTIEEIKNDDCQSYDGYYYDGGYYCVCDGEITDIENCFWCEYMDEYYPENEANLVHIGNADLYYSNKGIERHGELYEYRGEYYDIRALSNADLCLDYEGDVRSIDDVYYWESDGNYHDEPEEESEEYLRGYHDGNYKTLTFTKKPKFFIGFEIEKEDETVKESIYIDEFENNCPLWRKERDGSLNNDSGFELISPAFELKPRLIKEHIVSNDVLVSHINADKGYSCGGHINLSEVGKTGLEFFECIKGFTPLIYALYHKRINVNYSKGKSNKDLISENEKYQSIKIHSDRVEFRIVSAVPNVDTLLWRCELMNLITKNQTSDIKQAFFFIHTVLRSHLAKMYKKERLNELIDRVIKFTLEFEGIKLEKQAI